MHKQMINRWVTDLLTVDNEYEKNGQSLLLRAIMFIDIDYRAT